MSTVTHAYFHSASLRQRFLDELGLALDAGRIDPAEQAWLKKLTLAPPGDEADPQRVDRLTLDDDTPASFELAAALLLSHSRTADSRIYLFTLASGLEVFSDRQQLLNRLIRRFASDDASVAFEYEKIDGDAFTAQMRAIVEFQARSVRQLTAQFRLMPSLFSAVNSTLDLQLSRLLPHLELNPARQLMRVVQPAAGADPERVLMTQTLAQAAFEDVCRAEQIADVTRQFLDAQGHVVSGTDAQRMAVALSDTITALPARFAALLGEFWRQTADGQTGLEVATASFRASLLHALYRRVHDGRIARQEYLALMPALQAAQATADPGAHCKKLTVQWADGTRRSLAGTFACDFGAAAGGAILWFTPEHDLERFDSLASLAAFCSTAQGREMLRVTLALEDQPLLSKEGLLQLSLEEIAEPLLAERMDSILALQARNLQYVCRLTTEPEKVSAMFDDALDVRPLIDPRQQYFSVGRWTRAVPMNFARTWGSSAADDLIQVGERRAGADTAFPYGTPRVGLPTPHQPAPSWLERTRASDAGAAHLRQLDNTLVGYAEYVLQGYLCVALGTRLLVRDVRLRWLTPSSASAADVERDNAQMSESVQAVSTDLVSLLLEHVSGHYRGPVARDAQILLPATTNETLDAEFVNLLIERAAIDFIPRYLVLFQQSRISLARLDDRQLQPVAMALSLREDALRLDLALRQRMATLPDAAARVIRQVLDSPARTLRVSAGAMITEVFTVSLVYGDQPDAALSDALVLWQPMNAAAGVMLWVGAHGWRQFESVQALSERILRGLRTAHAQRWFGLLGDGDRTRLQNYLAAGADRPVRVRLERVDGHAIEALQQTVFMRQLQNLHQLCARAVRCRFQAQLFTELAISTELDEQLVNTLDSLAVRIDSTLFEELLPQWLKSASISDLKIYNDIWRRFYLVSNGEEDFLFGIPTLGDYARERLIAQLAKDFPGKQWDPDQITVTLRRYVPAMTGLGQIPSAIPAATVTNRESLTDYAVNRFVDIQDGTLTVESVAHPDAIALLSAHYLRGMIRHLDVGAGFMALLRQALNPADANWTRRNKLYVDQLPPMMQAVAMQQKLEGTLSAQACAFISRVVEMPDGIAREPVGDTHVIISPLRLMADDGMTPDLVKGVYLIGPLDASQGPVVLHPIVHPDFVFREYPDLAALMAAIRTDEALQRMLLERIDPEVRKRYEHGGFVEPHLPFSAQSFADVPTNVPGPVKVSLAEEKGNALQLLFTATMNMLIDLGVANTVTTAQADLASRTFLGMLGLEQALSVLPGKLATMAALWQSHTLFRASAASASGRQWGQAISEFSAALAVMATAREQADNDALIAGDLAIGEDSAPATFAWAGLRLTAEQLKRLQALEARSVSLRDLRRDELLSLYLDRNTQTSYAALAGKVYQVRRREEDGQWMIVGEDGTPGPALKLDSRQRWQLDLDIGLKGGGGLVTKMRSERTELIAEDALIIEASGMQEIREVYRERALSIGEAHLQAKRYLENCLDNLNVHSPGAPLDPRVTEIIGEFFGVNPPGPGLVIDTERAIKALFDEIMDASLSPYSSPRFVIGSARPGQETTVAFIVRKDPKRRIYLTERYFEVPPYALVPETPGFDMEAHYRAATLIHELSHLVLGTHDIAYLETSAPYPDLLLGNNANDIKLRSDLERLQAEGLSHRSAKADLFVRMGDGEWSDLGPNDGKAYSAILNISETATLEEAREVFLTDAHKRSRILLANADSVTLLILRLGRCSFVVPSP